MPITSNLIQKLTIIIFYMDNTRTTILDSFDSLSHLIVSVFLYRVVERVLFWRAWLGGTSCPVALVLSHVDPLSYNWYT